MINQNKTRATDKITNANKIIQTVLCDIKHRKNGRIKGLSTGFFNLDPLLSGLCDGNLIAVAGHPGIGTTSFALSISEHLSIDQGIPVLYFSMETAKEMLIERISVGQAGVELYKASKGRLDKKECRMLDKAALKISKMPLFIDDTSRLAPSEIADKVKILKKSEGIKFVVIDFLQAMRLPEKIDLHETDFAVIANSLKLMALKLNIPVLLLAHLNFDLIQPKEEAIKPRLADLGEAISVERYADVLILIDRYKYYSSSAPDDTCTDIIITKNRNGSTGVVALNFNEKCARFENIS
jgi:replicative DNA helicase